jgi:hypothetical protein
MNTTEMLAQLRLNCNLEDTAPDYTDAVLLRELSDALVTKFQDAIVGFRNGVWQQSYFNVLTTGQPRYRLKQDVTVLSKVEIGFVAGTDFADTNFVRLPLVHEGHANLFEASYNGLGQPGGYVLRGNDIVLLPTPDSSAYVLKITHFRRPSRLYASQNAQAGTDRGRVTAVDNTLKQITVNAVPFDMSLVTPAAITSANRVDVVKPDGWFDMALGDVAATLSSTTFTITSTQGVRDVRVGDYVRAYGQTDWPMLPLDFHRCVVDVASTKILIQRGYQQKASNFAGDVTADLQRFETLYGNRTREEPRIVRAPLTTLRRWRLR